MIKIDKMDSSAIRCPTHWSLLNTAFFRDGNRLEVGLIGSVWSGLHQSAPIHFRTIFDDLDNTGSSMQFSTLLLNLHEKATSENRHPVEWVIGADKTAKETKNQWMCWSLIWLLCVLSETVLWSVMLTFLLVGHTHDMVDRIFSRLKVVLRGRNDSADKQKRIIESYDRPI